MAFGLKWLKPELDEPKYWIHVVILVLIVYFLVGQFITPMQITFTNVWQGVLIVAFADTVAHTVLQMD